MSELSQKQFFDKFVGETDAKQAFNELLQADDAASSQPFSPAVTVSDGLVAEKDPYQDCTELNDAANSQHHSPAASVIALSSASDEDYEELGDVVEQVCGASCLSFFLCFFLSVFRPFFLSFCLSLFISPLSAQLP